MPKAAIRIIEAGGICFIGVVELEHDTLSSGSGTWIIGKIYKGNSYDDFGADSWLGEYVYENTHGDTIEWL